MDCVWVSKIPCGQFALNARYLSKVPDCAQSEEMFVLCPFWDFPGSCGMQTRIDSTPYEDHSDN